MKYYIAIFLFISSNLVAQNINFPSQRSKIHSELRGKSGDFKLTFKSLLKDPEIKIAGCKRYTTVFFQIVTTVRGKTYCLNSKTKWFTKEMLDLFKQVDGRLTHVVIQNIMYSIPGGQPTIIPGMNVTLYI